MMQPRLIGFCVAAMGAFNSGLAATNASDIAGTWRGESVCRTNAPACHNESVVYYIKELPNQPDRVMIQADKIVDGRAVTMGTGEWQYDRAQGTLEWRTPQQTWLLKVLGYRIEGTLTLVDGTLFRKMRLEKDK